jgi:hypothetical protein
MNTSRPIAENLGIAIARACWSTDEIATAGQSVFRKPQNWIPALASDLRTQFSDPPKFIDLLTAITNNSNFRQAASLVKTKKNHRSDAFSFRTTQWLDWGLPRIEDERELASHLGIRGTTLHWLTNKHLGPDDRPTHYATRWIKKRSGRFRLIESPKSQLKAVQRLILQDILCRIPLHPAAHGFRKKRSVITFVRAHTNRTCCLRMDLKDFFPSVRGNRVRGLFRSIGFSHEVARTLALLTTTSTHRHVVDQQRPVGHHQPFRLSRLYLPSHLPQGAPTSPAIANALAYKLDARLAGLANSAGANYSRYADDLLFSGGRSFAKQAERFAATVAEIAIDEGFEVNYRKTQVQMASQRQHAAGIVLNQYPNIRRDDYDRLKATLFNSVKRGPASQNHDQIDNFAEHLSGRINWFEQVNPSRGRKLRDLFKSVNWD